MELLPAQLAQPSLFEILSKDALDGLLLPTFRHVVNLLAAQSPRLFLRAAHWTDEAFAVLMSVLTYTSLTHSNATLTDEIYCLERVSKDGLPLSRIQKMACVADLVLPAYFKLLIHGADLAIDTKYQAVQRLATGINKIKTWLKDHWHEIHLSMTSLRLLYRLAYLVSMTSALSPINHAFGILVKRSDPNATKSSAWKQILPTALLLLSALHNVSVKLPEETLEIVNIPAPPKPALDLAHGLCPITRKPMAEPTLLIPSGLVFEYSNIYDWVQKYGTCPVTQKKAVFADLRPLKIH